MKIALINPPILGHDSRGTGVYAKNLATELEKQVDLKVDVCDYNFLPLDVDLYHFPYFDPFFLTLPPARRKKTVVTIHDLIPLRFPQYFPRGIKGEFKWQFQKRALKTVDAIITDSQASLEDIVALVSVERTKVHPIYLAPSKNFYEKKSKEFKEKIHEKYKLPAEYVLYVGDLNWNKNVPHIIKAITLIRVPLVIISKSFVIKHEGTYHPWKESLLEAQKLASQNPLVRSIGYINTDELAAIYQMSRALVFPSYYEGFGLPVVEAFASGCPVVTTKRGSLAEIAGEAALFVDPDDIHDIANAIKKLLSESQLRNTLIVWGKRQLKNFSWEKTCSETIKVYKSILSGF